MLRSIIIISLILLLSSYQDPSSIKTFDAQETDSILINPYSGLVNYGMECSYGDYLRKIPEYIYPEAIVYLRPVWGDLEPQEGKLELKEFESIRDNHLKGGAKQWAFRIVTAMPNKVFNHATPLWVRKAGAKGTALSGGGWEPQYGDPIYLEKFSNFIQKIAERYDGDPTLAFVDISGFGYFSEWGDPASKQEGWDKPGQSEKDTRALIDIFLKAFRKTPLAISTHIIGLHGEDRYSVQYALDRGAWNRRDGVGSPFFHDGHKQLVDQYWEDRPVITEWYGIYGNYNDVTTGKNKNWSGWNFTDAVHQALDQHGIVAEMSRDLDKTDAVIKHSAFEQLAREIGYRLVLSKALFNSTLKAGEKLILRQYWKNQGVGKLYVKYPLRVYLCDSQDRVIWSEIDHQFDPTDWKRGNVYEVFSSFTLPNALPSGTFKLKVGLVNPEGVPSIALGMEGADEKLRYTIGTVEIEGTSESQPKSEEPVINLARTKDAVGHVAVTNGQRPFYYVAPINDGLMRVSVSDGPGDLSTARQAYGIQWKKEYSFNTIKFYAGDTRADEGGWFERDLWVEVLKDGKWKKIELVSWDPVYPFDERAADKLFTINFNTVSAEGVRVGGYVGRRYSKWASVREIEVFNLK